MASLAASWLPTDDPKGQAPTSTGVVGDVEVRRDAGRVEVSLWDIET